MTIAIISALYGAVLMLAYAICVDSADREAAELAAFAEWERQCLRPTRGVE